MKTLWLRFAPYLFERRLRLLAVAGLACGTILFEVLNPWPLKLIVDHILKGEPLGPRFSWLSQIAPDGNPLALLLILTVATILLFVGAWICRAAQSYLLAGVGSEMVCGLATALFDHLQHLSLRFHRTHKTGDLVKRMTTDTECIRQFVASVSLPLLTALLSLVVMLAVMYFLDRTLALTTACLVPVLGLFIWHFAGPMTERTYQQYERQGDVMALAEQTLTALPIVKAFTREGHEDRRFARVWRQADDAYLAAISSQLQFKIGTGAVTAIGTALLMALGGWHVVQGTLTVGGLVIFLTYLTYLYTPLETLAYLSSGFATASAGARRVFEVMDSRDSLPEIAEPGMLAAAPQQDAPRIEFEKVTFGYRPDKPVLREIDLRVEPGETLALVGPTGAGKSTLVSLIPRFYDPWHGVVRIHGADVREFKLAMLREQISMVFQEPCVFPLSVSENIALGKPDAPFAGIEAAAKAARAHDFIERLPRGYHTLLGEGGVTLSGGEQQRIALARAFLKDAPILILDEPSSALDSETEHLVMEAHAELVKGRSTLIIAHRLSTIRAADRIIVLDAGEIVEIGRHEELLRRPSRYARLMEAQYALGPSKR